MHTPRRFLVLSAALGALVVAAPASARSAREAPLSAAAPASSSPKRAFAYYYLWWSADHWRDRLGGAYGAATANFTRSPLPLPATVDAGGCTPISLYAGNTLTDTPAQL